jgi:hypothetical protein
VFKSVPAVYYNRSRKTPKTSAIVAAVLSKLA